MGYRDGPGKQYQWLHYNEALLRAKNFGAGLVAMGLSPGPDTFVGIYSQNCPEWILTEQGLYCQSMVIVPLYDTLGPEACNFIINQGKELHTYSLIYSKVNNYYTFSPVMYVGIQKVLQNFVSLEVHSCVLLKH